MNEKGNCWCGNKNLTVFSPEYLICDKCQTLISNVGLSPEQITVDNDETDFYGKGYWDTHQKEDLDFPDIKERSRSDLSERCLHWLQTVMKYKLPPAKALELGCAHGGFVALLEMAGYDATGLELSPSVVQYAQETFGIQAFCGPVEEQEIDPASLDIIALMDVIEHLPDPVSTMKHCLSLLKTDGILIIQCPCYQPGKTHKEMLANNDPFLQQLKSDEHLYLFSESSIRLLFEQLGAKELQFEQAIFGQYDMFLVIGRTPLKTNSSDEIANALTASPHGRLVLALQDIAKQREGLTAQLDIAEKNMAINLETIDLIGKHLAESEEDRSNRLDMINKLTEQLTETNNLLNHHIECMSSSWYGRLLLKIIDKKREG